MYTGKFLDAPASENYSDYQKNQLKKIAKKWDDEINSVVGGYFTNQGLPITKDNFNQEYFEKIYDDKHQLIAVKKYYNSWSKGNLSNSNYSGTIIFTRNFTDSSTFMDGTFDDSGEFVENTGSTPVYEFNWKIETPTVVIRQDRALDTNDPQIDHGTYLEGSKPQDVTYSFRWVPKSRSELSELSDKLSDLNKPKKQLSDTDYQGFYDYFPKYKIPTVTDDQYVYTPYYKIDDQDKVYGEVVPKLLANKTYSIVIGYDKTRKQDPDVPPKKDPDPGKKTIPWTPLTPATKIDNTDPTPEPQPEPTPEIPETPDHPEKPATSDKPVVGKTASKPAVNRKANAVAKRQAMTRSRRVGARVIPTSYHQAKANYRHVSQPVNHTARRAASLPQTGNKNYVALGAVALGAAVGLLGLASLRKRKN